MAGIIDIDDAVHMRGIGSTFEEIGRKYGVSRQAVQDLLKKNGVSPRRHAKIYEDIPYQGLYDFVMANPGMSLSALSHVIFGSTTRNEVERTQRILKGHNFTLRYSNIRRLESASGMTFDELFAPREYRKWEDKA